MIKHTKHHLNRVVGSKFSRKLVSLLKHLKEPANRKAHLKSLANLPIFEWVVKHLAKPVGRGIHYLKKDMHDGAKSAKLVGIVSVLVFIGFFGIWGMTAPLEGAIVIEGSIVVDTNKKTVQHLEGGIIKQILVKDGDVVQEGQELIILQSDRVQSHYELFKWKLLVEEVTQARLMAERLDQDKVTYSAEILAHKEDPELKKIIEVQENLFKIRTQSNKEKKEMLQQRVLQLEKQIDGLNAQRNSSLEQIELVKEELKTAEELLKRGLEQRPRILGLKRRLAEIQGQIGEYDASIARARDAINETHLQVLSVDTDKQKETAGEAKEAESRIADIQGELIGAEDVYNRTVITAVRSGVITNLRYHTIGGVITPGAPIMDIVPLNDILVVEAKLLPKDIDSVHKDQLAKVLLTSHQARYVPKLVGTVTDVSPDRLMDEVTKMPYYLVRVNINQGELKEVEGLPDLYPGMPAQVFVVTDSATFMEYLLYPIRASMRKAFTESSKLPYEDTK